jgi:hypothetical protein
MKLLTGILLSSALASGVKAAVTLPYFNDYLSDDGQFTETSDAQWIESGGAYQNTITTATGSAATVVVTRPPTQNFVMQSRFHVTQATASYSFGFAALGTGAATNGATAGVDFYLADLGNTGTIRILRFNGATPTVLVDDLSATGGILGAVDTIENYDMTLTGTYTGADLVLSLTVFDGTNTRTVTTGTLSTPLAGTNFGYRDRNNVTGSYIVNSEFLSIAVPEPSAVLLAGAGAALGLLRRRRS